MCLTGLWVSSSLGRRDRKHTDDGSALRLHVLM